MTYNVFGGTLNLALSIYLASPQNFIFSPTYFLSVTLLALVIKGYVK